MARARPRVPGTHRGDLAGHGRLGELIPICLGVTSAHHEGLPSQTLCVIGGSLTNADLHSVHQLTFSCVFENFMANFAGIMHVPSM